MNFLCFFELELLSPTKSYFSRIESPTAYALDLSVLCKAARESKSLTPTLWAIGCVSSEAMSSKILVSGLLL